MTLEESYRILGLQEGASEEDRHRVYRELRERLNVKRDKAPTSGLELKYAEALKRIDQAIEVVESTIDAEELPVFAEEASAVMVDIPEAEPKTSAVVESELESPLLPEEPLESLAPQSNRKSFPRVLGAILVIAVFIIGAWFWRNELVERDRVRAETETVRIAEVKRLAEEASLQGIAKNEQLLAELEVKRAPLKNSLAAIEKRMELAETQLRDLEGAERVANENGDANEKAVSEFRREYFEEFVVWLRSFHEELPIVEEISKADALQTEGKLEEAIAAIGSEALDASKIEAEITRVEMERFSKPVERFAAERAYDQAGKESDLVLVQRDFQGAVNLIEPFSKSPSVGEKAKTRLGIIYRLKAKDAFERAQDAADLGEFASARLILETLDGDPELAEQSEAQLELIEALNSEYALEQAVAAAEQALDKDDFERAREVLSYLADDAYVGVRVKGGLVRIDEIEDVWRRNLIAIRTDDELAEPSIESESVTPDTLPKLIRKVDPVYPDRLRQAGVKGFVEIVWIVGVDGKPSAIDVVDSSHSEFEILAVDALKKWKFKPARRNGVPVALKVRQKIEFNPK
ncbi:MAG: energy transducer TonB [Opitutaceae bacterium]|nr:energy transducer TonB [Opitutaceae bacterium]